MNSEDTYATKAAEPDDDPREQELKWPARTHPDDLVLFDLYGTRFPGTWVGVVEDTIPNDQRNALRVEGFHLYRIRLLPESKAQVVVREDSRPDRDGEAVHPATEDRYDDYDPRHPRTEDT